MPHSRIHLEVQCACRLKKKLGADQDPTLLKKKMKEQKCMCTPNNTVDMNLRCAYRKQTK
jgi:hypothetical protein